MLMPFSLLGWSWYPVTNHHQLCPTAKKWTSVWIISIKLPLKRKLETKTTLGVIWNCPIKTISYPLMQIIMEGFTTIFNKDLWYTTGLFLYWTGLFRDWTGFFRDWTGLFWTLRHDLLIINFALTIPSTIKTTIW